MFTAESLNCNTLQIFTKNSSSWKEKSLHQNEIKCFKQAIQETGITTIVSHTSYLINLAGYHEKKQKLSCNALKQELIRSEMLGINYVVLHPGSHMGKGDVSGICRFSNSINEIFDQTREIKAQLLIETCAGQGSSIGHSFEQLALMIDKVHDKGRVGICLDTCHIFAAGYDIRNKELYEKTIQSFNETIGLQYLKLIHLNDSKKDLGSRVDRHEHIGKGKIGLIAFRCIMNDPRLFYLPKIIETPKDNNERDSDHINLTLLKGLINQ
ncbi:MAG: deoxyribonuclease IV [Desulfobacterales bacterium]|nr:deoxyribonuclease IV [Desulfobacterales bacterium]